MEKLTAIVMAAGMGTRLGELTKDTPKPLIMINKRPMIAYAINFLKEVGVDRIIVVGGYMFAKLKEAVSALELGAEIIFNKDYQKGNLYSLACGLEKVGGSFILFHVDHIFRKEIVDKVHGQLDERIIIFTDYDRKLKDDDDMKVQTDETGKVLKKVSKKLKDYSLGYAGITYCHAKHLDEYRKAVDAAKSIYGEGAVTEHAMQYIADNPLADVHIGDISGYGWLEIDTPEELRHAEREIASNHNLYW